MRVLALTLLIALPVSAIGAQQSQPAIYLNTTADGKDSLGPQLFYRIREGIRASHGMRLVSAQGDAGITMNIVTLLPHAPGVEPLQDYVVYSSVITFKDFSTGKELYYNNYVGSCGSSKMASCADQIVAELDASTQEVVAAYTKFTQQKSQPER